jgi:hypothetical protein
MIHLLQLISNRHLSCTVEGACQIRKQNDVSIVLD